MDGTFRRYMSRLRQTPLHPQWFALMRETRFLREACGSLTGLVLDLGCGTGRPRHHLPSDAEYLGIDYYVTATEWYGTRPDVFADARALPLKNGCIDHCLLLDVLEHIADPDRCLDEIHRSLRKGGTLTIQVPFMYPLHDAPRDFHRWTAHGLARAAARHGFRVDRQQALGHPLETAALTFNIGLSKTVLNWIRQRNPMALSIVLLPFAIPMVNVMAWAMAALSPAENMMPYAYRTVWTKE